MLLFFNRAVQLRTENELTRMGTITLAYAFRSCTFGPLSPVHLPRETYEMRLISPASVWAERVRERGENLAGLGPPSPTLPRMNLPI